MYLATRKKDDFRDVDNPRKMNTRATYQDRKYLGKSVGTMVQYLKGQIAGVKMIWLLDNYNVQVDVSYT